MTELDLEFSTSLTDDAGAFKLLELPPELCKLIETAVENLSPLRLSIKGQSGEDAVLCTNDATYTVRSVVLSNTILVVTPPAESSSADSVVIRDQVNEILELTPTVPKLHKLSTLLRGREYDDVHDSEDHQPSFEPGGLTYAAARATIQASDAELARGLRQQRILDIHGALRPIAPGYLTSILETILNLLVSQSIAPRAVPVEDIAATLADENEISRPVSTQVMTWFGDINDGVWTMDVAGVLREIGLGILRQYKNDSIAKDILLDKWKLAVGDTFEASVSLVLLSGNYLASPGAFGSSDLLTYFPSSSLPIDPPSRFIDLFLTRPRWKADDIAPFLSEIAVNTKDRDKLLLKYTRTTTDSQGVWYTKK
ncbi:sister chromatid cohesion protein Dcc1 [Mycena albidolilacea]|uniref:Sister chromatid cohesion protein Dcc1 n=1 Tax=Mycena albidolilacea TaxID=1033008 RepID=A0AAD7AUR9_9AGAR|nr:sister chromatid cohesion protein Dcc1 [Mycena albidolilacea]